MRCSKMIEIVEWEDHHDYRPKIDKNGLFDIMDD